jgi:uncharacterized protein (DUF433 family)
MVTRRQRYRITVRQEQCAGQPCVRGLRIWVKDILDLLAAGASHEEILQDYPYLEAEDIVVVLEFATCDAFGDFSDER